MTREQALVKAIDEARGDLTRVRQMLLDSVCGSGLADAEQELRRIGVDLKAAQEASPPAES